MRVLVAFSAFTLRGYTTKAFETFLMSSTMLKSSMLTIENWPSTSFLPTAKSRTNESLAHKYK
jgi:hypothetical protein